MDEKTHQDDCVPYWKDTCHEAWSQLDNAQCEVRDVSEKLDIANEYIKIAQKKGLTLLNVSYT